MNLAGSYCEEGNKDKASTGLWNKEEMKLTYVNLTALAGSYYEKCAIEDKESAGVWKPRVIRGHTQLNSAHQRPRTDTEEVTRTLTGILNRLVPEKFEEQVGLIKKIPIKTKESLNAMVDLIYERAVSEELNSQMYAQICHHLSLGVVENTKFRNLIINKCQKEFEKDKIDVCGDIRQKNRNSSQAAVNKLNLQTGQDDNEIQLSIQSVGNTRFIGELYKVQMLKATIMLRIINTLLDRGDDLSLECFCVLLKIIGKFLESQCSRQAKLKSDFLQIFKLIEELVKVEKTPSRIKFMMMDVIDLQKNNWVPQRKNDLVPQRKNNSEPHRKNDLVPQQENNSVPQENNSVRQRMNELLPQQEINSVPQKENTQSMMEAQSYQIGVKKPRKRRHRKMKVTNQCEGSHSEELLLMQFTDSGDSNTPGLMGSEKNSGPVSMNNGKIDAPGLMGSEQNTKMLIDNIESHGMAGNSMSLLGNIKGSVIPADPKELLICEGDCCVGSKQPPGNHTSTANQSSLSGKARWSGLLRGDPYINTQAALRLAGDITQRYSTSWNVKEAEQLIIDNFAATTIHYFVQISLDWVLERGSGPRKLFGQLYQYLISVQLLTVEQLLNGSKATVALTEKYEADLPEVCDYLGEIFAPCLLNDTVPLSKIMELAMFAGSKRREWLASVLNHAVIMMSPEKIVALLNASGFNWSAFNMNYGQELPPTS